MDIKETKNLTNSKRNDTKFNIFIVLYSRQNANLC